MNKKFASVAAAAAAAMVLVTAPVFGQVSVPVEAAENGRLWFVELAGNPTIEGRARSSVEGEHVAFRAAAKAAGLRFSERRAFTSLFNGLSVSIEARDRARFMALPGVKALHAIERVQAPAPEQAGGAAMDLASAITMTGASAAQNTRGLTGRNIKVGIIDTGIDIDHPAFGGGGTPNATPFPSARVVAGWDFVGDAYNANPASPTYNPVPSPDPNPDDCNGHGTHVAGIVGGNGGGIKGVAPGVVFGAYRVFGCDGSSDSDIILAAMERAHADGMQVINQSLGAARQWPDYPTAKAASRLVDKGIVMVASIGNNGPGGSTPDALFAAGAPGVGANVIGVASFDNSQRSFLVGGTPYGYTPASGSPLPPTSGGLPMARTGTPASTADACSALPPGSLTGRAVLIRRGGCTFYAKAFNAQAAGATAVVLYNNAAGALNATVTGSPAITIPVVGVTAAQGTTLDGLIAAGATTLTWGADYVSFPFGTGGLISGFSSFGLAADLSFKPDLGAPGGGIFSSYPLELGAAATLSGTSMSAPHVAGAVALILEARPRIPAKQMLARLQNVANPQPWSGNPGLGLLDHTHRQGAGMIDIMAVLDAKVVATPSKIAIGESAEGPRTVRILLDDQSGVRTKWTLAHLPALATGPNLQTSPSTPNPQPTSYNITGVFSAPATVTFDAPVITTPGRGSVSFDVTIEANASLPDRSIYGGYIELTSEFGKKLRVPYSGFKGDYQSTQVLTPTVNGFPWLAQLSGGFFNNRPGGASFTMAGDDIPFLLVHFDHLSRGYIVEAFDAMTGRMVGNVTEEEFMTRNSTPNGFFNLAWDGTTYRGRITNPTQVTTVPNGQYVLKITVLKALGNRWSTQDFESWTSPVITIARP